MATLNNQHPQYAARVEDWTLLRHTIAGERTIKEQGTKYLPATQGMIDSGVIKTTDKGYQKYLNYVIRAVFPEIVRPAIDALVGVLNTKAYVVELPTQLEPLRERCTLTGESIELLIRKVHEEQLSVGRHGLLLDVADKQGPSALPFVASYQAETILNWDTLKTAGTDQLSLVVLNETAPQRDPVTLSWKDVKKFRVLLSLEEAERMGLQQVDMARAAGAKYLTASVINSDDLTGAAWVAPGIAGRGLDTVPFAFVGSKDLVPDPDVPPLLSLARIALAIYRGEADYRHALHMTAQETLFISGLTDSDYTPNMGAGQFNILPPNAEAKYVGVEAKGLEQQKQALDADYERGAEAGGQLLNDKGQDAESGKALQIRVAARTASLTSIAKTSAEAVQTQLRLAARWVGANEDQVKVEPNLEFGEVELVAKDLVDLMSAKTMGAPLSQKSVHGWMASRKLTHMDYETELEEIADEDPIGLTATTTEAQLKLDEKAITAKGVAGPGGPGSLGAKKKAA